MKTSFNNHSGHVDVDAFLRVCAAGNLKEVERMVAEDPRVVDVSNPMGFTGLMKAIQTDHLHVAAFLVAKKADTLVRTDSEMTAWHFAAEKEKADFLNILASGTPAEKRAGISSEVSRYMRGEMTPKVSGYLSSLATAAPASSYKK